MKRRTFLKSLGCLPFLGFLGKEQPEAQSYDLTLSEVKNVLTDLPAYEVPIELSFSFGECVSTISRDYGVTYYIDGKQVSPEQWQKHIFGWSRPAGGKETA